MGDFHRTFSLLLAAQRQLKGDSPDVVPPTINIAGQDVRNGQQAKWKHLQKKVRQNKLYAQGLKVDVGTRLIYPSVSCRVSPLCALAADVLRNIHVTTWGESKIIVFVTWLSKSFAPCSSIGRR